MYENPGEHGSLSPAADAHGYASLLNKLYEV